MRAERSSLRCVMTPSPTKTDAERFVREGETLAEQGRYKEAVAEFEQALTLFPADWEIWFKKGLVKKTMGLFDDALAAFDRAMETPAEGGPDLVPERDCPRHAGED